MWRLFIFGILAQSCSLFHARESQPSEPMQQRPSGEVVSQVNQPRKNQQGDVSHVEKRQAELWARLDEIEIKLQSQQEKIRLLERGMLTGIVPEKIKKEGLSETRPKESPLAMVEPAPTTDAVEPKSTKISEPAAEVKPVVESPAAISPKEDTNEMLAKAQDLYAQGNYGASLAELAALKKSRGDTPDGDMSFWTAKNWVALKDYNSASEEYQRFLKSFQKSAHTPRAKLDYARVQNQLGFKNKAIVTLREIIAEKTNPEVVEMAQMELEKMKRTL